VTHVASDALTSAVSAGGSTRPELQDAGMRFASLMQGAHMAPPESAGSDSASTVGKLIESQDHELTRATQDAVAFGGQVGGLTMQEIATQSVQVMMEITQAQIDMEAKTSVVNASRSSLDTLMKNE
jgi:type III secretion inner rod protein HrpB2